jgi:hypothetical protein
MRHTFCVSFCICLFLSIDTFACNLQSEAQAITLAFYDKDKLDSELDFRVFTYDLDGLNRILLLKSCDEDKLLDEIGGRVILYFEDMDDQNLQQVYDGNVFLAEQASFNIEKMKYTEIATLVALYDRNITLRKNFQHGISFDINRLFSFLPINFCDDMPEEYFNDNLGESSHYASREENLPTEEI